MTMFNGLPLPLRAVTEATNRAEYDAALDALLQHIAADHEADGIPEGAEIDHAEALFQRHGFDGIPSAPSPLTADAYTIEQTDTGTILWQGEASNPQSALLACAQDAGYNSIEERHKANKLSPDDFSGVVVFCGRSGQIYTEEDVLALLSVTR